MSGRAVPEVDPERFVFGSLLAMDGFSMRRSSPIEVNKPLRTILGGTV